MKCTYLILVYVENDVLLTVCHISSRYVLKGATFYSGNHYRGAVKRGGNWFHYDGLWERQQPGSGLRLGGTATPHGFMLSSCIYVKALLL